MIRFVVWITLTSGERVRCGEVVCSDPEPNGKTEDALLSYYSGDPLKDILDAVPPQTVFPVFTFILFFSVDIMFASSIILPFC